jgi:hypothetical protein
MGHNPTAGLKPGAVPLMENIQTHEPVLAVENYGVGRTAAFTTGGSWYWRMNRPAGDELHQRFWKQLIRWLAVGSKPKLSTELKTLYSIGEPVRISVAVLGNSLEPVNDAAVRARVEDPFGRVEEFPLEWILVENGVYEGTWSPRDPGEHKLTINADYAAPASRNVTPDASKNDVKLQTATSFLVGESYVEFSPGWQNAPLLQELAERTGGRYYTEADASRMAADIEHQVRASAASNPKVTEHTLWDMPIVFLVLFLTLSAEWLLKRRSGLP